MDALKKAELELDKEMRKQVDIIYSAAAIAFARYWNDGWGPLRIRRIFDETLREYVMPYAKESKAESEETE